MPGCFYPELDQLKVKVINKFIISSKEYLATSNSQHITIARGHNDISAIDARVASSVVMLFTR